MLVFHPSIQGKVTLQMQVTIPSVVIRLILPLFSPSTIIPYLSKSECPGDSGGSLSSPQERDHTQAHHQKVFFKLSSIK